MLTMYKTLLNLMWTRPQSLLSQHPAWLPPAPSGSCIAFTSCLAATAVAVGHSRRRQHLVHHPWLDLQVVKKRRPWYWSPGCFRGHRRAYTPWRRAPVRHGGRDLQLLGGGGGRRWRDCFPPGCNYFAPKVVRRCLEFSQRERRYFCPGGGCPSAARVVDGGGESFSGVFVLSGPVPFLLPASAPATSRQSVSGTCSGPRLGGCPGFCLPGEVIPRAWIAWQACVNRRALCGMLGQ